MSDSRPEKNNWEMEMSPQWPRLQSQCRKWNGVPDHVLHLCSVQSGTAPPPAGFGPEALGQGRFFQRLGCVGFPQRYKLVWRLTRCRCFRSVTLIARRKVDCRRTSSPSWSSSSCNSAGKPSFPLTWNKKWALFFIYVFRTLYTWVLFSVKWFQCSDCLQIKVFSLSRLSEFRLAHVEDGYLHWVYTPSPKESSQPTENPCVTGKVISPALIKLILELL